MTFLAWDLFNIVSLSDGPSYSRRLSDLECEKCTCQWIFESPFPGTFNVNDRFRG